MLFVAHYRIIQNTKVFLTIPSIGLQIPLQTPYHAEKLLDNV
jgi:hypothetical protein